MLLLGPDAACSPGHVRRRRPERTGPTTQSLRVYGDTLRRCDTVIRIITDRGRRAWVAAPLSPVQPAASRSGDDLDSACRMTSGGGTGKNVVDSIGAAHRRIERLEYRTSERRTVLCQPDNGSPIAPVASSSGPCCRRVTSGAPPSPS